MPDYCKCNDSECPKRNQCCRFLMVQDKHRQTCFADSPRNKETGSCEHFWNISVGAPFKLAE